MYQYSAGKEVLSYCSKCKLMLASTIVSTLNSMPAKVQCRTCKTTHQFRPQKPTKSKAYQRKTHKSQIPVNQIWEGLMQERPAQIDDYTIRKTFKKNHYLQHPKFGIGIVQQQLEGDKIEVLFRYDIKILVHNKI